MLKSLLSYVFTMAPSYLSFLEDNYSISHKDSFPVIEMQPVDEEADDEFNDNDNAGTVDIPLPLQKNPRQSSMRPSRFDSMQSFASISSRRLPRVSFHQDIDPNLEIGGPRRWRPSVLLTRNSSTISGKGNLNRNSEMISSLEIQKVVAADVAACIINESKTLGLMAALLSSWAATVYAGEAPMDEGLCYGRFMLKVSYVIFMLSLGFFFVCVSSTLAIIADLDGVPQKYLFKHLQTGHVRLIYQLPQISMIGGVVFLAVGYSIDVGERAGCNFLYSSCLVSFGFVSLVAMLFSLLKNARKQLRNECIENSDESNNVMLGRYYLATWRDRLDYMSSYDEEMSTDARKQKMGSGMEPYVG